MEQDRLSNLPKFILHDILSRLSTKYAVRTSVLSKAWAETWSTFPILSFSQTELIGKKRKNIIEFEDCLKRKKFCDNVERTLLRFHNQGLAIKQFKLTVNNFQDMLKDIDIWLKLATERGVEVLELHEHYDGCIRNEVHDQRYILPTNVLETKSLTKLVLLGRIRIDLSFMNHPMKFFSLQVLTLEGLCSGDEHVLKHLISRCPFIEYITLGTFLRGKTHRLNTNNTCMKSLSLHGLSRLKSLDVQGIQEVNVDVPCLEKLYYIPSKSLEPCKIDFDKCRSLKRLCLSYLDNTIITDKWFLELSLKFPFLESLEFKYCTMPERIRISSDRLKVLALSYCSNLDEIKIAAPNLLSCSYVAFDIEGHDRNPLMSFLGCSNQLVVNVGMGIEYKNLCNFREFIQNFKHQTVLASVVLLFRQEIAVELDRVVLQVSSPPPSIKHLKTHLYQIPHNVLYLPLVNRLLSSCCPATITLYLDSDQYNRAFIKVLYETLMGINKDKCFCSSSDTKCWWHDLKGVEVSSSMMIGVNVDFKTMLETCKFSAGRETIVFQLKF